MDVELTFCASWDGMGEETLTPPRTDPRVPASKVGRVTLKAFW